MRKAAVLAIDKKLIVRAHPARLRQADRHAARAGVQGLRSLDHHALRSRSWPWSCWRNPAIRADKPVEFTIQTTRGFKPKDYETIQAIVEMWRRVGIKANIEVYEIAKHFELRTQHKLAPAAFYNWGNSTRRPGKLARHGAHSASRRTRRGRAAQLDAALNALFIEKDDAKRMAGYKALNRLIAENAYILPLFQFYQPVVYKTSLKLQAAPGRLHPAASIGQAELRRRSGHVAGPPRCGGCCWRSRRCSASRSSCSCCCASSRAIPIAMMIAGEATPEDIAKLRAVYGLDKSIREQFVDLPRPSAARAISACRSASSRTCWARCSIGCPRRSSSRSWRWSAAVVVRRELCAGRDLLARPLAREYAVDGVNSVALADSGIPLGAAADPRCSRVLVPLFPISGRIDPMRATEFHTQFYLFESLVHRARSASPRELLAHLALPAIALALPLIAVIARVLKTSLLGGHGAGLHPARPRQGLLRPCASWCATRCPMR